MEEGIDQETENDLRNMGGELIAKAGIYLRLPQVAIASAQVLFQRFFFAKSFVACDMQTAAKASIWLASKIEENVRRVRDVINVFNFLENQRDGKNTDVSPHSNKMAFILGVGSYSSDTRGPIWMKLWVCIELALKLCIVTFLTSG